MTDNRNVITMQTPAGEPGKEWLPLEEAAGFLEKSTRHVQRLASANLVVTKMVSRPGQRPERLYHYPDLQRIRLDGVAAPVIRKMPEPPLATIPSDILNSTLGNNPPVTPWAKLIPEIFKHWTMAQQAHEHAATAGHQWLTIDEAHTYCKASKARILRAAQAGVLVAIKDPSWKVRQSSLDAWDGTTEKAATNGRKRH